MPPNPAGSGNAHPRRDEAVLDTSATEKGLGVMWALAAPIRSYVRRFPIHRGKGWLIRHVLLPLLPPAPFVFPTRLPGGSVVHLQPRETLGYATLIYGGFETVEIALANQLATEGTTAFDIGANVGIYAVALAGAVGAHGRVVAVEPDASNVQRLRGNLELNRLRNVEVLEAVAGEVRGVVELHIADDAAYNSLGEIEGRHVAVGTRTVQSVRLDDVWHDIGRPSVSFAKIDVEGAEASVIRGARTMLATSRPSLLIEANDEGRLDVLRSELEPLGYRRSSPAGFQPWNHLFVHAEPRDEAEPAAAATIRD